MELLERFAAGDLEAFEVLFRQHQGEVYAWTVRIVRDTGIAEDLTVETFWRIYKNRTRFKPDGNFRAWARRIATNAALDHLRRTRHDVTLPENLPCPAASDGVVRRQTRNSINAALHELPPKYRLVVTLALVEDESYADIAQAAGISESLVKIRVFRAVRMLRKKLNFLRTEAVTK